MTIATDAFVDLLHLEAEQRGLAALPHVVVPHPLGGLHPEQVRAKVDASIVEGVLAALARTS